MLIVSRAELTNQIDGEQKLPDVAALEWSRCEALPEG
jgi:hypothetical protein